jgi:hypothetical protein
VLKITVDETEQLTRFRLEGKLSGPWVEELERVWLRSISVSQEHPKRIVADICGATFVDPAGRELLARMYRQGVKLEASGCMNRSIVEGIERTQSSGAEPRRDSSDE